MSITLCVILITSSCYAVSDINEFVKETHCREKGTFTTYNKNSFKFVENEIGTNIALECRYW